MEQVIKQAIKNLLVILNGGRVARNQWQKWAIWAYVSPLAAQYQPPVYVDIVTGRVEVIVFLLEMQYTMLRQ